MSSWLSAVRRDICGDLRYAIRQLRKSPTFTTVAILTLAIGIGANTIIFSQVNAVMLRMLPVKDPEQLYQLEWTSKDRGFANSIGGSTGRQREGNKVSEYFSYRAFTALSDGSKSFFDLACYASQGVNFGMDGRSDWGFAYMVSSNYFQTLGSEAALGRTILRQLILFGAVALLLCAMGIYGMLAYTVGFRTREIGLRMALGAQRSNVVSMVIRESLIPVAIGIAMGLTAAFALTRLVESMLYGVKPNDPTTIVVAAVVFLVIAAIAAFVPARRASRTEPMSALRYE